MLRSRFVRLGLTLAALTAPSLLGAQERTVVGKQVSVGRSEAALRLEFQEGPDLEIALRDGALVIDGTVVGAYEAGDPLDAAFRSLAGMAVALDDGPLSATLREWSPPATLDGDRLELARTIDRALEDALRAPTADPAPDEGSIRINTGDERSLVRLLLNQAPRLELLQEALGDLTDASIRVHVQEDVEVGADETVVGTLVVIEGDARIEGRVEGDVVVVDGRVDLIRGSSVGGSVRLVDARLGLDDGEVGGRVEDLLDERESRNVDAQIEREIRERIRDEIRSEIRNEIRHGGRDEWSVMSPFRSAVQAVGGAMGNLMVVFVLGVLGMIVCAFAGENLAVVAETARRAPGRAAVVGFAGSFLLVPVWVLGTVALAVSIVGIPVVIAWVPLFPVAALAAGVLGFLAVSRNLGEWLADSDYRGTDWIRRTNPVYTIFGGLLAIGSIFVVANLLRIVPFVGAVRGLLTFAGGLAVFLAVQIGFGAVLLTRAGRRPETYPIDAEEAWRRAVEVDIDDVETGPAGDGGPRRDGEAGHA
ncbi:MAG: tetraspanin family protein [Longimicrobiales bacterium]